MQRDSSAEPITESEIETILSALDERNNPFERWEYAGRTYAGIRVVGDKEEIKRILDLGSDIRKMEYWIKLVEIGDCEIARLTSGQYKNRYRIIDRTNHVGFLLVEPSYKRIVPLWLMSVD